MNENINVLIKQFTKISRKRWIHSTGNGHGNVGMTFEHELGKKLDDKYLPDYLGIEIKTTTRFSRFPISLFSVSFENRDENYPEIKRLIEHYGHYDSDIPDKKVLFKKIRCNKKSSLINNRFRFQLEVDFEKKRLYLCVYNILGNLCDRFSYISFDRLKEHLETKLKYLAIVKASKKFKDNQYYFRYYKLAIYTLKNFDIFLKLLEEGIIITSLIGRINKSGDSIGKYANKNLVFQINKKDIYQLFDIKYVNDLDHIGDNSFNILNI